MLKVKVIDLPVFYDGKRYLKGEELVIISEHYNDSIFELLEELVNTPTQDELLEKFYKENTAEVFKELLSKHEIEHEGVTKKDKLFELILDNNINVLED